MRTAVTGGPAARVKADKDAGNGTTTAVNEEKKGLLGCGDGCG